MKNRIENLRAEVERHNRLYYVENAPEISDRQFDEMLARLEQLEKEYPEYADPNSPTQRIGSDLAEKRRTFPHRYPMQSIRNSYASEQAIEFAQTCAEIIVEYKYDGVGINLQYTHGKLSRALTRGNGQSGSDITPLIRTLHFIPLSLPQSLNCEIRGELYVRKSVFARETKNGNTSKTPRSYAQSAIQLRTPARFVQWPLNFVAYTLYQSEVPEPVPASFGFETPVSRRTTPGNLRAIIGNMIDELRASDIPADGLVIKPDKRAKSTTAKYDPSSLAYKFDIPRAATTLLGVTWNVSKSGTVTPVAVYRPVQIGGIETWKCTLHNPAAFEKLHLSEGCTLTVELAGTAVPSITRAEPTANPVYKAIDTCPVCGFPLIEIGKKLKCPNTTGCPAQTGKEGSYTSSNPYQTEIPGCYFGNRFEMLQALGAKYRMNIQRKIKNSTTVMVGYNSIDNLADLIYTINSF